MITNFKIFENKKIQFLKVPIKAPDFFIALKKSGMNDNRIEHFKHLHNNKLFYKNDYRDNLDYNIEYVILRKESEYDDIITWMPYRDNKYLITGEITVSPEEVQKYYNDIETEKDMNKYNL